VNNTNVDRSVATIHATVLGCLRRQARVRAHCSCAALGLNRHLHRPSVCCVGAPATTQETAAAAAAAACRHQACKAAHGEKQSRLRMRPRTKSLIKRPLLACGRARRCWSRARR
jgi:hypothetical protein